MNIIFIYKTTYTNESLNFFIDALDLFVRTIVEKPKIAVSADQRRIFANARTVSVVSTAQGRIPRPWSDGIGRFATAKIRGEHDCR